MALGCMAGAATLLVVQGPLAPLPAYYLPLGAQSLYSWILGLEGLGLLYPLSFFTMPATHRVPLV